MWNHYADGSKGVAIRTTVGKLLETQWRLPFSLSVDFVGSPLLRRIKYFSDTAFELSEVDDLRVDQIGFRVVAPRNAFQGWDFFL